jgi:hypothetical protein
MKIAGFTFVKNAVKYDYPIVESINSILPLVDEYIVLCGDSEDATESLIRSIQSPKIRIHHSVWDPALKKGGYVLADETNKAFDLISPDMDWVFYLQADEVLHEKYFDTVRSVLRKHKDDQQVEGFLFPYTHFWGTYDYVGDSRKWYSHEIRIIRNDKNIRSYKDAQGFRKHNKKLQVKLIDASIYHYGWVRHPTLIRSKTNMFVGLWGEEPRIKTDEFDFLGETDSVKKFTGTHPAVMRERIKSKNWTIDFDPKRKKFSFKDALLYRIEKLTGKRLFAYRNYKII